MINDIETGLVSPTQSLPDEGVKARVQLFLQGKLTQVEVSLCRFSLSQPPPTLILLGKSFSFRRWFQPSNTLSEKRTGVHRLHQCLLYWCKHSLPTSCIDFSHRSVYIKLIVAFTNNAKYYVCRTLKSCLLDDLPSRATGRRTILSQPRAPCLTQWRTSGGWCGSGGAIQSLRSPNSKRGSRYSVVLVQK